jgi:signal transduction histidine kinase
MRQLLIQLIQSYVSRARYPITIAYVLVGGMVFASIEWYILVDFANSLDDTIVHATDIAEIEHTVATHTAINRFRNILAFSGLTGYLSVSVMVWLFERANKMRSRRAELSEKALDEVQHLRSIELERIQAERARILESVSHELNTPITSVLAFSSILEKNRDKQLSDRDMKHVAAVKRNAEHLAFLIKDLINYSELEDSRSVLSSDHVNMSELVVGVVESIEPLAATRGQKLQLARNESTGEVHVDRLRINQVLMSLLNNAIKYSPNGSVIEISVEDVDDGVAVSITDNGPGIDPFEQDYVWQPFYRSNNEWTRAQSGSGPGLSLVRKIIEMHGGSVDLTSEPDAGTTVRIVLPLANHASDGPHEFLMPA